MDQVGEALLWLHFRGPGPGEPRDARDASTATDRDSMRPH